MTTFLQMVESITEGVRVETFPALIARFEQDLRVLTRNLPKMKTYAALRDYQQACQRFTDYFDTIFAYNGADASGTPGSVKGLLDRMFNTRDDDESSRTDYYRKAISKSYWALRFTLNDTYDWREDSRKYREGIWPVAPYRAKVNRELAAFLKLLKEVNELGGEESAKLVTTNIPDQVTINGLSVVVRSYDPNNPEHGEAMEAFKESIPQYRRQVQKNFPWLANFKPPLILEFSLAVDKAGFYEAGKVYLMPMSIWTFSARNSVLEFIKVRAHETGHFIFKRLPKESQKAWTGAIYADRAPLDPRDVLAAWPESIRGVMSAVDHIAQTDLPLAARFQVASTFHREGTVRSRDELLDMASRGEMLSAPRNPITPYGDKNPEEGFCEAISLLVGLGPRAIPPAILRLLNLVTVASN